MSMQEPPPTNRRRQAIVGTVGLAAVLGVGAYVVTAQFTDQDEATSSAPVVTPALEPPVPEQPASEQPNPEPPVPNETATSAAASSVPPKKATEQPARPSPSRSLTVDEKIKEARRAAARDGYDIKRPVTAAPNVKIASGPVSERSEKRPNGSLRVISAKHDLTGQRELLWAADKGRPVGDATCTQTFRFSNNVKPSVRPNMLLCFRTSATKSVVTVLVSSDGKPSRKESAAIIAREWAKLG